MSRHVAVVGAGLVGFGWTIVFARAGAQVRVFDGSQEIRRQLRECLVRQLEALAAHGLLDETPVVVAARVEICDSLSAAVKGARYVQESILERVELKREVSAQIAKFIDGNTVVGSSTSGIPASAFTEDVTLRERFLVAHPVNPPYLAPVVELVPAPWTAPEVVEQAVAFMQAMGQSPVKLEREVEGFILNRLQGVLLREAWALYDQGYATLEDIDRTVRDGLGLRWSFMGPFETIDLNAVGGIRDYAERLGGLYHSIAASGQHVSPWQDDLIERVERERRASLSAEALQSRMEWRDQRLMALSAHKRDIERDTDSN